MATPSAAPAAPVAQTSKWHDSIPFVLVMLFLVLGPLGIPLLWKSPKFSLLWKIALTAAVLLLTYWIISLAYSTIGLAYKQLPEY